MLILILSLFIIPLAAQLCDIDMIEEHAHFTRIYDKNKSRECSFDTPDSTDWFLDIERYSDSKTVDMEARFNISVGDTTLSIHSAYIQIGEQKCSVPMQTKLEQTIWIHLHFDNNGMTVQVSPANTAYFGHCQTVANVNRPPIMHIVGSTHTGMEQVLRGIHADRPSLQDPGQTVVMRKTIHELERRIHILEKKQEKMRTTLTQVHVYHSDKHEQHTNSHKQHKKDTNDNVQQIHENIKTVTQHLNAVKYTDDNVQQIQDNINTMTENNPNSIYFWGASGLIACGLVAIVYRLWILGVNQEKLYKFKL
jgi:hypothetical protein